MKPAGAWAPVRFEFATAGRVVFGAGALEEAIVASRKLGSRPFVVTGGNPDRARVLTDCLEWEAGAARQLFQVAGEPTIEVVERGVAQAREAGCDWVVAMGGGGAIDAGKAVAAMLSNPGSIEQYLEVIGQGQPLTKAPVPFVAVPTTAGTGAEVTRNAVLASPTHRVKVSLRSPKMLPSMAVVDPELTWSMPPAVTASTGMDALTQVIEPFVSSRSQPMTDAFCREGIRRAARSLRRAFADGQDREAREDMALCSLLSGLALANAGLGAVHGFAAPLGGMYPAPHGAVCAALLPEVMQTNWQALQTREPNHPVRERFMEVAQLLTGRIEAKAEDGIEWLRELRHDLGIPPLSEYGVCEGDFDGICRNASRASSMKPNPIALTHEELSAILRRATEGFSREDTV